MEPISVAPRTDADATSHLAEDCDSDPAHEAGIQALERKVQLQQTVVPTQGATVALAPEPHPPMCPTTRQASRVARQTGTVIAVQVMFANAFFFTLTAIMACSLDLFSSILHIL